MYGPFLEPHERLLGIKTIKLLFLYCKLELGHFWVIFAEGKSRKSPEICEQKLTVPPMISVRVIKTKKHGELLTLI